MAAGKNVDKRINPDTRVLSVYVSYDHMREVRLYLRVIQPSTWWSNRLITTTTTTTTTSTTTTSLDN
jgi:hypothetical protein